MFVWSEWWKVFCRGLRVEGEAGNVLAERIPTLLNVLKFAVFSSSWIFPLVCVNAGYFNIY